MEDRAINLMDGRWAIFFPYHMVTEMTLMRALPHEIIKAGKPIKFAAETSETAGKKRADSAEIERTFPIEVALLRQRGFNLSRYVIITT